MAKLNNTFSKIETPKEWKTNLYAKAYAQEEKKASRPVMKRIGVGFVAAAACATCAVAAGAATGKIDLGGLFGNDEVTASKIESGEYQQILSTIDSGKLTFTATAFVGDEDESYTILEARPNEGVDASAIKELSIDAIILGTEITYDQIGTGVGSYFPDTYRATAQVDENGNIVFYFKLNNYEAWVDSATSGNKDLNIWITAITTVDAEGNEQRIETELMTQFTPNALVLSAKEDVIFDRFLMVDGAEFTLDKIDFSDYETAVVMSYKVPDDAAVEGEDSLYWTAGEKVARTILTFDGDENYNYMMFDGNDGHDYSLTADKVSIKLYNKGELLDLASDERPFEMIQMLVSEGDNFVGTNSFELRVKFAPTTIESIEDITIEFTLANGSSFTVSGADGYLPGAAIEGEAVEDEIVEDEVVEDEIVEDEIVEDEAVEDEIVEDEAVEDEIAEDEAVEGEEIVDETTEEVADEATEEATEEVAEETADEAIAAE